MKLSKKSILFLILFNSIFFWQATSNANELEEEILNKLTKMESNANKAHELILEQYNNSLKMHQAILLLLHNIMHKLNQLSGEPRLSEGEIEIIR